MLRGCPEESGRCSEKEILPDCGATGEGALLLLVLILRLEDARVSACPCAGPELPSLFSSLALVRGVGTTTLSWLSKSMGEPGTWLRSFSSLSLGALGGWRGRGTSEGHEAGIP